MKSYSAFGRVLGRYWRIYGGWSAMLTSVYFHVAIVLAVICYPLWIDGDTRWATFCLGAVPNLLGFSIGAFAIILSFGGKFVATLQNADESRSSYLGVVAAFVHFILVQTLALLISLVGAAHPTSVGGFIGFVVFAYALILAVAATMRLFRLARINNLIPQSEDPPAKVED